MKFHTDFKWTLGVIFAVLCLLLAFGVWNAMTVVPPNANSELVILSQDDFQSVKNREKIRIISFYDDFEPLSEPILERIREFPNLEVLHLYVITDNPFPMNVLLKTEEIPHLKELYLPSDQVTQSDLDQLRQRMPKVKIFCSRTIESQKEPER